VGLRPPKWFKFSICWPVYIVEILGRQDKKQDLGLRSYYWLYYLCPVREPFLKKKRKII
jgi:hypothetical protein